MRLAIFCTFIGSAIGAELVQHIDASLLTSMIPLLLIAISLYFLLAPQTRASEGKQKISEAMFALCIAVLVSRAGFFDQELVLFLPSVLLLSGTSL